MEEIAFYMQYFNLQHLKIRLYLQMYVNYIPARRGTGETTRPSASSSVRTRRRHRQIHASRGQQPNLCLEVYALYPLRGRIEARDPSRKKGNRRWQGVEL